MYFDVFVTKLVKYLQISVYFFEKKWLAVSKRSIVSDTVSGTRSSVSDTIQHLEISLETATFQLKPVKFEAGNSSVSDTIQHPEISLETATFQLKQVKF